MEACNSQRRRLMIAAYLKVRTLPNPDQSKENSTTSLFPRDSVPKAAKRSRNAVALQSSVSEALAP
jgi:hypothetical protein